MGAVEKAVAQRTQRKAALEVSHNLLVTNIRVLIT
jgi:hypothetical protein